MTAALVGSLLLWLAPMDVPPPKDRISFGLVLVILLVVLGALIALMFLARRRGKGVK